VPKSETVIQLPTQLLLRLIQASHQASEEGFRIKDPNLMQDLDTVLKRYDR
jgi:hypothetical protein